MKQETPVGPYSKESPEDVLAQKLFENLKDLNSAQENIKEYEQALNSARTKSSILVDEIRELKLAIVSTNPKKLSELDNELSRHHSHLIRLSASLDTLVDTRTLRG